MTSQGMYSIVEGGSWNNVFVLYGFHPPLLVVRRKYTYGISLRERKKIHKQTTETRIPHTVSRTNSTEWFNEHQSTKTGKEEERRQGDRNRALETHKDNEQTYHKSRQTENRIPKKKTQALVWKSQNAAQSIHSSQAGFRDESPSQALEAGW